MNMLTQQKQRHLTATEFMENILDPGSFRDWHRPIDDSDADPEYREELSRARARSGGDESIIAGEGLIRGRRVALVVSEFGFLGGSIGHAAAERIVHAVEQ